jgi:hypothetical protein
MALPPQRWALHLPIRFDHSSVDHSSFIKVKEDRMPQYTLTLTWLTADNPDRYDGNGNLAGGAHYRRLQAITVAKKWHVTDPAGHPFHPYNQ